MKRWLSVLVLSWVLIGLAGAMPVAAADPYPFVSDPVDSYILIKDAADLTAFAAGINDGSLAATPNARLTDNIVLRETEGWAE